MKRFLRRPFRWVWVWLFGSNDDAELYELFGVENPFRDDEPWSDR